MFSRTTIKIFFFTLLMFAALPLNELTTTAQEQPTVPPIHIGDPAAIGADLREPLFGPPVPPTPDGIVPVFWACGVTPQSAAENAGLPFFIAHAPAHSFITDLPATALMNP